MQVKEVMTHDVRIASPDDTIHAAARLMAEIDAGFVPVGENDRLIGILTDRDIAVRAVALGKGPDTLVRDVMSADVKYCFDYEDVDDVAHNMGDLQVRRLPVVNRDKRLVGILALGNLATPQNSRTIGETVAGISRRGGPHSQKV